jgi:hypothetical protein
MRVVAQQVDGSGQRPPVGLVLARGLGWGALLGMVCGFVIPTATDLLTFRDSKPGVAWFLLGLYTAPFGLMFGAIAGIIAAACFVPLATLGRPGLVARIVSAVVGPLVVAGLSLALFNPRLEVGPNETQEHLNQTILMFYLLPCCSALVAGALFGDRLARSQTHPPPTDAGNLLI